VGQHVTYKYFTVFNKGDVDLLITSVDVAKDNPLSNQLNLAAYQFSTDCLDGPVPPGGSCSVNMVFAPTTTGKKTALLQVASSDPDEEITSCPLFGNGVKAGMALWPSFGDFGWVEIGQCDPRWAKVTNTGTAPLHVTSASISGATRPSEWHVSSECGTVAPGASCYIKVTVCPTDYGLRSATLRVYSDAGSGTIPMRAAAAQSCGY